MAGISDRACALGLQGENFGSARAQYFKLVLVVVLVLESEGHHCVTKGKISFCVLFFPLSNEHLLVYLISDSSFSIKLRG